MTQSQEQRVKLLRLELDAVTERQRLLIEELQREQDRQQVVVTTPRVTHTA